MVNSCYWLGLMGYYVCYVTVMVWGILVVVGVVVYIFLVRFCLVGGMKKKGGG